MELFFYIKNNEIIEVATEEIEKHYKKIELSDNFDIALDTLEKEFKISKDIYYDLEKIYRENVEIKEEEDSNSYKIKHWVSNRSFGELIDMYKNNEIQIPDMQRSFVWDSNKCSRLIESIIMGLPIPPLFLLEMNDNTYEIIDGYQRLNTLYNFKEGKSWTNQEKDDCKSKRKSRISKNSIIKEIAGKTFEELDDKYKLMIRRSTIPLIEFKQLKPDNVSSKYLIFERINTGSEKLHEMQIRKSLAYGELIKKLYIVANEKDNYFKMFSKKEIKNDFHVEVLLRIIVMKDIYDNKFIPQKSGINNILNEYCQAYRNDNSKLDNSDKIFEKINFLLDIFTEKNICRKVNQEGKYVGYLNICILEALVGNLIQFEENNIFDTEQFKIEYNKKIKEVFYESSNDNKNPFSINTGTIKSIKERFNICKNILNRCKKNNV